MFNKVLNTPVSISYWDLTLRVIWCFELQSQLWKKIDEDERFTSYCTTDVFDDFIAIGNLSGIVKIVRLGKRLFA